MKSEKKNFLPSPRYKPLGIAVVSLLVGFVSFAFIMMGLHLGEYYLLLTIVGIVIFLTSFIICIFNFIKMLWVMFIKGGWQEEQKEYLQSQVSTQPWEK